MVAALIIALVIVSIILAVVELSRSRWQSLLAWAVIAVGAALLIGRFF